MSDFKPFDENDRENFQEILIVEEESSRWDHNQATVPL
jgi:hypothetical protein